MNAGPANLRYVMRHQLLRYSFKARSYVYIIAHLKWFNRATDLVIGWLVPQAIFWHGMGLLPDT